MTDADVGGIGRRAFLRVTAGLGALAGAGTALGADGTVQFEDQTVEERTLVVARIETSIDATGIVFDVDTGEELVSFDLSAGTYENYEIRLNSYLRERRRLEVNLYPASGGSGFAKDAATVSPPEGRTLVDGVDLTEVSADPGAGFEYPYFLYAPAGPSSEVGGPVLVEPNNTGTSTNDLEEHRDRARRLAEGNWNGGSGRHVSDQLLVPFVVPVFPRPRGDPVDSSHYTHQLDRKTMQIEGNKLERIDEQLLAMVDDARERLRQRDYPVDEGLLLNGFSASGNFVTRFATLHPDEVTSVTAGGINGMAVLPRDTAKGLAAEYHVGVRDVGSLTGSEFDPEAYAAVDQFLYMGALDFNDTLDPRDFDSDRLERLQYRVFGPNMQRDRLPYVKWAYEEAGIDGTVFRIYDGVTHNPRPAFPDLVEFHRRALNGGDTAALGGGVEADPSGGAGAKPTAEATVGTQSPTASDPISLDGSGSAVYDDSLQAYAWTVSDGGDTIATAAGEQATVTVAKGEYEVKLRVVDGQGRVATDTATLAVEASSEDDGESQSNSQTDTGTEAGDETGTRAEEPTTGAAPTGVANESNQTADGSNETAGDSGPGPGIVGTLTGIGGAGYLLWRNSDEADETE